MDDPISVVTMIMVKHKLSQNACPGGKNKIERGGVGHNIRWI